MNYAYDILLNFINEERVYEFFEWQKKDNIKNINRIPIFLLKEKDLANIINNKVIIDKEFLKQINDKTIVFEDRKDYIIKYACIITDKTKCFGIKLNEKGEIIGKSTLLLDEENEILENIKKDKEYEIKYNILKTIPKIKIYTRNLEKKINYILLELDNIYKNKNYDKLDYLYQENFIKKEDENSRKYDILINEVISGNTTIINKIFFILKLSSKNCTERRV